MSAEDKRVREKVLRAVLKPEYRYEDFTWCDNLRCLQPATQRLHLPTGPACYCPPCAAWMLRIMSVLGTHVHVEEIPLPAGVVPRGMDLKGVPG